MKFLYGCLAGIVAIPVLYLLIGVATFCVWAAFFGWDGLVFLSIVLGWPMWWFFAFVIAAAAAGAPS